MSKRKINQQQQRRIEAKQAQILDSEELSGLVIAHFGKKLEIEAAGESVQCDKRQNLGVLVPGDIVRWHKEASTTKGVVVAIEPRKTLLSRPDSRGNLHAVAANVDQMFIVSAPIPAPQQTTIDRYLLAAASSNIEPVIILNKEDLLGEIDAANPIRELLAIYKSIGIRTLLISAKKHQHLDELKMALTGKTSVFVGQSGVGKSSIISTLLPDLDIKVGAIADSIAQGKHTTTTARLYHLNELDAQIIDSPGMREFPLWKADPATIAAGFIEFRPFLHECKFRNCRHVQEPGCALLKAAETGKISPTRLASYQRILADMQQLH